MMDILFVSVGGFIGAICRFAVSKKIQQKRIFPLGTFSVNMIGAFLLGVMLGLRTGGHLYSFLGVGFMGAFTTFSTFKLESEQLRQRKRTVYFYSYLLCSYILGIGLAFLGMIIGRKYI
jgi:CrcB protein